MLLRAALVELVSGDQQHLVAGREEPVEGVGRVVVGDGEPDTAFGEVGGLRPVTDHGVDLLRRDLPEHFPPRRGGRVFPVAPVTTMLMVRSPWIGVRVSRTATDPRRCAN
ncbi:hypothetical protein GCM10020256_30920 [Streptomyces thermocoprophilus]